MQNPYQTLGVDRNAAPDEIKRAYRRLASQHHPDKGGDKAKFQEIQSAYDLLTNPNRPSGGSPFGDFQSGGFNFDHIFDIFGARFQHPQQRTTQHARMSLWVTIRDIASGGKRTISVGTQQGTHAVEIEIPLGITDGDTVQYPGIGPAGMDLVVTFRIHPDPEWQRQDLNLITERTIEIWDLILGSQIQVRDVLQTTFDVKINPGTQPGTKIRLKGRGLRSRSGQVGDLLIRVQVSVPTDIDSDLLDLIRLKYQK